MYLYASLKKEDEEIFKEFGYDPEKCPRGFIVGAVEITGCAGFGGDYEIQLAGPERLAEFLKPVTSRSRCSGYRS